LKNKRRLAKLTADDRKRICEQYLLNPKMKQATLGALFGVERSTVSKILKNRDRWLAPPDSPVPVARPSMARYPELEGKLVEWCRVQLATMDGERLTDEMIKSQALAMAAASEAEVRKRFKASTGWMEGFKVRFRPPSPRLACIC
jgi:hypothetical protein